MFIFCPGPIAILRQVCHRVSFTIGLCKWPVPGNTLRRTGKRAIDSLRQIAKGKVQ